MSRRVVVAITDGPVARAQANAMQLRDAGAEVIWLGKATPVWIATTVIQEAADEVLVFGKGKKDVEGLLAQHESKAAILWRD